MLTFCCSRCLRGFAKAINHTVFHCFCPWHTFNECNSPSAASKEKIFFANEFLHQIASVRARDGERNKRHWLNLSVVQRRNLTHWVCVCVWRRLTTETDRANENPCKNVNVNRNTNYIAIRIYVVSTTLMPAHRHTNWKWNKRNQFGPLVAVDRSSNRVGICGHRISKCKWHFALWFIHDDIDVHSIVRRKHETKCIYRISLNCQIVTGKWSDMHLIDYSVATELTHQPPPSIGAIDNSKFNWLWFEIDVKVSNLILIDWNIECTLP